MQHSLTILDVECSTDDSNVCDVMSQSELHALCDWVISRTSLKVKVVVETMLSFAFQLCVCGVVLIKNDFECCIHHTFCNAQRVSEWQRYHHCGGHLHQICRHCSAQICCSCSRLGLCQVNFVFLFSYDFPFHLVFQRCEGDGFKAIGLDSSLLVCDCGDGHHYTPFFTEIQRDGDESVRVMSRQCAYCLYELNIGSQYPFLRHRNCTQCTRIMCCGCALPVGDDRLCAYCVRDSKFSVFRDWYSPGDLEAIRAQAEHIIAYMYVFADTEVRE